MIELTFDQAALTESVTFAGELHQSFVKMLAETIRKTEADRVVISPTALTVIVSGSVSVLEGEQPFKRCDVLDKVIGHIDGVPLKLDPTLDDVDPVTVFKNYEAVAEIRIKNVSFL